MNESVISLLGKYNVAQLNKLEILQEDLEKCCHNLERNGRIGEIMENLSPPLVFS